MRQRRLAKAWQNEGALSTVWSSGVDGCWGAENGLRTSQKSADPKGGIRMSEAIDHQSAASRMRPGCRPARCGRTNRQARMNAAITADASGRLNARPPWLTGLSRKSPTVAPSGRVRMKALQNSDTRETFVHK